MAFINELNQNQAETLGQTGMVSPTGAVAGASGSTTGSQATDTRSTAGRAGQWTNVQDILRANPLGGSMKESLQQSGQQMIERGKARAAQAEKSAAQQIAGITPQQFSGSNVFESPDYEAIKAGLSQEYAPQDFAQTFAQDQAVASQLQALSGGSRLKSLTDFYGLVSPQSARYTPAKAALDQLILSGDADFVRDFGQDLTGQYQREVFTPMTEAQSQAQGQSAKLASQVGEARSAWSEGLSDYLKGQKADVLAAEKRLKAEARAEKERLDTTAERQVDFMNKMYPDELWRNFSHDLETYGGGWDALKDYYSYDPGEITNAVAARETLGSDGVDRFNKLSYLLGDAGAENLGEFATGGGGRVGEGWVFDRAGFEKDAEVWNARARAENAAAIKRDVEKAAREAVERDRQEKLERKQGAYRSMLRRGEEEGRYGPKGLTKPWGEEYNEKDETGTTGFWGKAFRDTWE